MFDHIGIDVTNLAESKAFYLKALAPLGISVVMEFPEAVGLGVDDKPAFWLSVSDKKSSPIHIAFSADTRKQVDEFYQSAIAAGGTDNGPPGIRADYDPNYYAAYIFSPEGHNIEVVCHAPQQTDTSSTIPW